MTRKNYKQHLLPLTLGQYFTIKIYTCEITRRQSGYHGAAKEIGITLSTKSIPIDNRFSYLIVTRIV